MKPKIECLTCLCMYVCKHTAVTDKCPMSSEQPKPVIPPWEKNEPFRIHWSSLDGCNNGGGTG